MMFAVGFFITATIFFWAFLTDRDLIPRPPPSPALAKMIIMLLSIGVLMMITSVALFAARYLP